MERKAAKVAALSEEVPEEADEAPETAAEESALDHEEEIE